MVLPECPVGFDMQVRAMLSMTLVKACHASPPEELLPISHATVLLALCWPIGPASADRVSRCAVMRQ